MRIILLGFMGSGKSVVSAALAKELNYNFFDIDKEIENSEKITISEIFNIKGEDYFRKLETEQLKKLSLKNYIVIASGGGTPCFENNIQFIKENFVSIYLDAEKETLITRLMNNTSGRPLLNNKKDINITVDTLLTNRIKFYTQATYSLKTFDLSIQQIVYNIIKLL